MAKKVETKLPKGISMRKDGVHIGRFTINGIRYNFYNKDLKALQNKIADAKYEIEHNTYIKPDNLTYDNWFITWIQEYKVNDTKIGSRNIYQTCYQNYIKHHLGKIKLTDMRGSDIDKVYQEMVKKGLSQSTIDLCHVIIKSSLKQAVKKDLILGNPDDKADVPKLDKNDEMRVLTLEEQVQFLIYAKSNIYYKAFKFAINTGLRSGELRGLTWDNIDFNKHLLYVKSTLKYLNKQGYFMDTPKTKSSYREVPIKGEMEQLLKELRKIQLETKMLLGDKWKPKEGFENLVFTNNIGAPISPDALNVNVNKIVKAINQDIVRQAEVINIKPVLFEDITPHTFRHTFATRCVENGIENKTLSAILGHSSIQQTMDLYVHITADMKLREMDKVMKAMGN